MKSFTFLAVFAILRTSCALMSLKDFESSGLEVCYDTNMQDSRRISDRNINGQVLPLPNSVETFISLVERYESMNPGLQANKLVEKILKSFRMDDLKPKRDVNDGNELRDTSSFSHNKIKRLIFSISDTASYDYGFKEDDFTNDEKCALHFMLSHTINDTKASDTDEIVEDSLNRVKEPREFGVVSLHAKRKHAFALGRVLLGIYAGFLPSSSEEILTILQKDKKIDEPTLVGVKINPVFAVTVGDLVTRLIVKDDGLIYPNGLWNDMSCPTEYKLEENKGGFISYSELRGGVDGLLIGRRIQENRQDFSNFHLSQILRMYYGYTGLFDTMRTRWCSRESNLQGVSDLEDQMLSYFKLFRASLPGGGSVAQNTGDKIRKALNHFRDSAFNDVERDECSILETSPERRYTSPRNIFAILDLSGGATTKLDIQTEIISNLSYDFDTRPNGNLMGVYTNVRPLQQNTLDIVTKNSGTAGCPSCFAKYYKRPGNKQEEDELFRDLNDTLGNFDEEQGRLEELYRSEMKAGSPGKVVLYFNFGSSPPDYRVNDALWRLKQYYGGATILAVGDNRQALNTYVANHQTDIFTISPKVVQDIRQRLNKVPAEFTFKECYQSSAAREADNKQEGYVGLNKIQYWAMYPQYFLKSFGIKLKFKAQEGTQIRVCFSRWYGGIVEGKVDNCKDSTGGEIIFYETDPCKKRNVFNCEPFYFSVEGKKPSATYCQSLRCNSVNDIQFQFEHEGISCNFASYVSVSSLALLFSAIMYYIQRQ